MCQGKREKRTKSARKVEESLRIKLLRSIIRKKQEQEQEKSAIEDFITDEEVERLEKQFNRLQIFMDTLEDGPAGQCGDVFSFDELLCD